jgi:hypothetical protein
VFSRRYPDNTQHAGELTGHRRGKPWPPTGNYLSTYGENLMAADTRCRSISPLTTRYLLGVSRHRRRSTQTARTQQTFAGSTTRRWAFSTTVLIHRHSTMYSVGCDPALNCWIPSVDTDVELRDLTARRRAGVAYIFLPEIMPGGLPQLATPSRRHNAAAGSCRPEPLPRWC